jgi:dTDP-4-dehydrorhamnose 3,5-epimerase
MDSRRIAPTRIDGLEWRENLVAQTPNDDRGSHYYVIANTSSGISDILYYPYDEPPTWLGLHIGQDDMLTFLGDPNIQILGHFVDCRAGSRTLHRRVILQFSPNPTKHLFIHRGIAHTFTGIANVTVRTESAYFMPEEDVSAEDSSYYELSSDSTMFRGDDDPSSFPTVHPNPLPLPDEALSFILHRQQEVISVRKELVPFSNVTVLNGEEQRIRLTPKRRRTK